jgi:ankyrin repeat protein
MNELIYQAIKEGNLNTVDQCIKANYDKHRRNANIIKCCAINGQLEIMKYLISVGYEYFTKNKDFALKWAAIHGHAPIVKYFIHDARCCHVGKQIYYCLQCQQNFNLHYKYYYAFRAAARNGHLNIVKLFCDWTPYFYWQINDNYAFRIAAKYGHMDIFEYFIDKGVYVDDLDHYTLRWAIKKKHYNIISRLINNNNELQINAFAYCSLTGNLDAMKYLVGLGVISENNQNVLSLAYCCCYGHINILKFLISWNFNPAQFDTWPFSTVHKNWQEIYFCLISAFTKKNMSDYMKISNGDASFLIKIFGSNFIRRHNFKYNLLKFSLRPLSMHTQLCFI